MVDITVATTFIFIHLTDCEFATPTTIDPWKIDIGKLVLGNSPFCELLVVGVTIYVYLSRRINQPFPQ